MIKANESTLKRFASRLKFARKKKKLSQKDLGVQIDRVQQEINRLEHGTTYPNKSELEKIANVLDVDPDWLSGITKQKCEYKIHENDDFIEIKVKLYKNECNQITDLGQEKIWSKVNRQSKQFKNYFYNIVDAVTSSDSCELEEETKKTYFEWGNKNK